MMGDDPCAGHEEAALSRAVKEEYRHFLAVLGEGRAEAILREAAAAMFGAGIGEARRLVRERGERAGPELRRLAGVAEAIERRLPHRLYLAWRTHFVDGRALPEYARLAGLDDAAARADYRELVGVLVTLAEADGGRGCWTDGSGHDGLDRRSCADGRLAWVLNRDLRS